jgi:radical SAM protein with 4Fe4S-binding SPASM domain
MDVDLFRKVIDEVGPYLLTASLWGWGEPLLHPNLQSVLEAARRHNIAVLLSTNGKELENETIIQAIVAEPPAHLIVSIDGLTDETNSRFRVGTKLEPILSGVKRIAALRARGRHRLPVLHMRFIAMKHNQHEIPGLVDFARENHFDMVTVRSLSIVPDESTKKIHRELIPDDNELRAYDYTGAERSFRRDFVCQEPFWFPTVFADGTLVPCDQDYNAAMPLGVISDGVSFRELWYGKAASKIRKTIRDTPFNVSFCRQCPYRDNERSDMNTSARVLNDAFEGPLLI